MILLELKQEPQARLPGSAPKSSSPPPVRTGCTSLWEEKPGQTELGLSDLGSRLSQILRGFLDDSGGYHENCVL